MKSYKQIKYKDRLLIAQLFNNENKSLSQIAAELKKNKSSISREVTKGWNDEKKGYDPALAQQITSIRAARKGIPRIKRENKEDGTD